MVLKVDTELSLVFQRSLYKWHIFNYCSLRSRLYIFRCLKNDKYPSTSKYIPGNGALVSLALELVGPWRNWTTSLLYDDQKVHS